MFYDRVDAGEQMAERLSAYKNDEDAVVVALPRGGVVPGYVIANMLNLPLDVAMVKKLGHPSNKEYAIGAVSLTGRIMNGPTGVSQSYIEHETKIIQELLKKRYRLYRGNKPPMKLKNKKVILVDDGIASGRTLIAALELIKEENPSEVVVAAPVGPTDVIRKLKLLANKVICLEVHDDFYAVGLHYRDFSQVLDEEVQELLEKADGETVV